MKFAKELEDQRVAEWQSKYFDYRKAKKKIKAISRAQVANTLRNPSRESQQQPLARYRTGGSYGSIHSERIQLQEWQETFTKRKDEFLSFLEYELKKVADFYEDREHDFGERLQDLKGQLHLYQDMQTRHQSVQDTIFATQYTDYMKSTDPLNKNHKKKLKLAMEEFYRGLEMLKSYGELNSKAFRKINKKFDKAVNARPTMQFYNQNIKAAYFVTSDMPDKQIQEVEDLYARYFERGNRKLAVSKLKSKRRHLEASVSSSFRNGLLLAIGIIGSIHGIIGGYRNLNSDDPTMVVQTAYLLQLYGGYFLLDLLMLLFCLACGFFKDHRVNYQLVFELDPRTQLDWTQLSELPLLAFALQGTVMWCNFSDFGPKTVEYIYWFLILIGFSIIIIFLPFPILQYRARFWFLKSLARVLLMPAIRQVEFRDFFLGDMFCSQTYAMGNIEVFFCLYVHQWVDPGRCNSNVSRLMGFFQAYPGIVRLLQCLRRAYSSSGGFRVLNLINAFKYTCTIVTQMMLSIWRIDQGGSSLAIFGAAAVLNGVVCSTWDLLMDWSLFSRRNGLRSILGFPRKKWIYYVGIIIDPLLRFNFIPYLFLHHFIQHSAITSFTIALTEVLRRGFWLILRVENEHCSNVKNFKAQASRALPFIVKANQQATPEEIETALERPPLSRVGTFLSRQHEQDYVKRNKSFGNDSSDEEDEE